MRCCSLGNQGDSVKAFWVFISNVLVSNRLVNYSLAFLISANICVKSFILQTSAGVFKKLCKSNV